MKEMILLIGNYIHFKGRSRKKQALFGRGELERGDLFLKARIVKRRSPLERGESVRGDHCFRM